MSRLFSFLLVAVIFSSLAQAQPTLEPVRFHYAKYAFIIGCPETRMGCVPMVEIAGQKYPVDIMNTSVLINVPEILTRQEGQCSNLVGFFTVEVGYMPNPTVSATVFHVTSMKAPKNPDLCFK